ncbi:hypothetical protein ARALYDRAFT_892953 [Arabidopsis lyrata subsp. lyrata]|uniref:Uncharacterized protein n=1 Tax=Arabidopsis lyrata subsp. lyrata TaxID=81972 RepID=D7KS85_ARALL|nr:hypothetical protein ARALYDRAFT_892953 [Arabidopsis lyrata subsp. lyrata]
MAWLFQELDRCYLHATQSSFLIKAGVNTDVREAFCAQIGIFVQHPIVSCLFLGEDATEKSCERFFFFFFNLIEHSLATAKDLLVIQTLLETTAQVMVAVDVTSELFLFCLFLLIDHPNFRACYIHHVKGGFATLLSRAAHIQNDLFDNLSVRLTSRPNVVREFAEAVLGVETEQLVRKMVPVVLRKLLLICDLEVVGKSRERHISCYYSLELFIQKKKLFFFNVCYQGMFSNRDRFSLFFTWYAWDYQTLFSVKDNLKYLRISFQRKCSIA